MLRPRQCDEHTHAGSGATIKKPLRWDMINPHNVEAGLAHQRQIDVDLFRPSEIISLCIRFERSVGNPFDKKFLVSFEKEFRNRPNPRICCPYHVKESPAAVGSKFSGFKGKRFSDFARNDKLQML